MAPESALTERSFWDSGWLMHKPRTVNLKKYQEYRVTKFLDNHLPQTPSLALEVGAGNSAWLPYMAQRYGYRVVGLDYSEIGCRLLKANLREHLDRSLIIQGDLYQDCFVPAKFDVVFSTGLVEHFTNYQDILALFASWLKPGGTLVTLVPNKRFLFRHVEKMLAPDVYKNHILFEPHQLAMAYENIGMGDISASYLGSFSTWKYNSYTKGFTRFVLQAVSRSLCAPVHTFLRSNSLEPESRQFSPIIAAVGLKPYYN